MRVGECVAVSVVVRVAVAESDALGEGVTVGVSAVSVGECVGVLVDGSPALGVAVVV